MVMGRSAWGAEPVAGIVALDRSERGACDASAAEEVREHAASKAAFRCSQA